MVAMRYKVNQSVANRLLRLLNDITIYEAKQLLDGLAYEYMLDGIVVIDGHERKPFCKTTFMSHYNIVWERYDLAKNVRVQFPGGPPTPTGYKWFIGSLVTFVCDRMLYYATAHGSFGKEKVDALLIPYEFMP